MLSGSSGKQFGLPLGRNGSARGRRATILGPGAGATGPAAAGFALALALGFLALGLALAFAFATARDHGGRIEGISSEGVENTGFFHGDYSGLIKSPQ